jgi:hypothetical protein
VSWKSEVSIRSYFSFFSVSPPFGGKYVLYINYHVKVVTFFAHCIFIIIYMIERSFLVLTQM